MKIAIEHVEAAVPVSVMSLVGDLDASSYLEVIDTARSVYEAGGRNLLVDLSDVRFMASSGLVALHSMALIMRGNTPPDPEAGWGAFHAMANDVEQSTGHEAHCKLLSPQPRVARTLETTGFDTIFAVYTDRQDALASFSA